ncbi:MAG TPA: hypothetical protein VM784_10235 [Actinomycetota bacterium]|nr:hypothetical protein [Actinomycetota bacterium]
MIDTGVHAEAAVGTGERCAACEVEISLGAPEAGEIVLLCGCGAVAALA